MMYDVAPPGGRKEPLLEYWEILNDGRYQGQVFGRPGYEDGDVITTGTVVKVSQTHVTTASGTTYKLGRPKTRKRIGTDKEDAKPLREKPADKVEIPREPSPGNRVPVAGRRASDADSARNGSGQGVKPALKRSPSSPQEPAPNRLSPANAQAGRRAADLASLEQTNRDCKRSLYVGDRVRVIGAGGHRGACGEVLYIGPANFANGRQVCGMKLDKPQPGSVHDGKEREGERYFRCAPGHGCYVLLQDVQLIPREGPSLDDDDFEPPFSVDEAIRQLVGMQSAKQYLKSLRNRLEVGRKREVFGVKDPKPLHTILVGSLGMDFQGLAVVLAGIFQEAHVLPKRTVHAVGRKDLVGANSETTNKLCDDAIAKAKRGLLLVLDASNITSDPRAKDKEDFYGTMALNRLISAIEHAEHAVPFVLVLAVRRDGLSSLMQASPALAALAPPQVELAEYSIQETASLLRQAVMAAKFELSPTLTDERLAQILSPHLSRSAADKRGMELVRRLTEEAIGRQTDRVFGLKTVSKESLLQLKEVDFEDAPVQSENPTEQVLARLNAVVGLSGVKTHVQALIAQLQLEKERRLAGLPGTGTRSTNLHMIFSGNPGTGKTTVARIISEVLQSMGILRCGHCVETDRADLVAGYVGQTALKVHEVVQRALGGVLFVDEAYALVKDDKDQFGREALDTLMKLVEDYRDDLVVVLAGYPKEIDDMISHNPGVRSRFPTVIVFEDYTVEELLQIADIQLAKSHMELGPGARAVLEAHCQRIAQSKEADNGNGRAVRNIVERALRNQALRLVQLRRTEQATGSPQELCVLTKDDFDFVP